MDELRIGLTGIKFNSGNKGCAALAYSFLDILNRLSENLNIIITLILIEELSLSELKKYKFNLRDIRNHHLPINSPLKFGKTIYFRFIKDKCILLGNYSKLDCVIDFTEGDSFTDIYGQQRFMRGCIVKEKFIKIGKPLILGSQTIGPIDNASNIKKAVDILSKSFKVYVRDIPSAEFVKDIAGIDTCLTSDVAFFLSYSCSGVIKKSVGFNPSGLLWSGGYTKNNQFGLKVDYKIYCVKVIESLISAGYEIHLIPYVYGKDLSSPDNDLTAINFLHNKYSQTVVAPTFATPMEAKSYISRMSFFIGSRMHATIAALSSSVPVIPFAYSRKFSGLFNSIGYSWVIDGQRLSTEQAVDLTLNYLANIDKIKDDIVIVRDIISKKNKYLLSVYGETLSKILNKKDI